MRIKKHKEPLKIKKISGLKQIKEKYKDKVSELLEIPIEIMGDSTRISMVENKIIYFEGSNKIEDYYSHFIKIKTHKNTIIIDGKNMVIKGMGNKELVIEGEIMSISYNGG